MARHPMRIRLTEERRIEILEEIRKFYDKDFDEEISPFRSEKLLEFFLRELGPPVYNQAVQDSSRFMHEKLLDLEGEIYEPED